MTVNGVFCALRAENRLTGVGPSQTLRKILRAHIGYSVSFRQLVDNVA